MQLGKQDLNHSSLLYHHNAVRLPLRHTQVGSLTLGKVAGLPRNERAISLSGCQNTLMPKSAEVRVTSMNTALLCRSILADHLKAMSSYTIGMVSRMIIDLRTLNCLFRKFIGDKSPAPIAEGNLQ